jgi:hypothetical protein
MPFRAPSSPRLRPGKGIRPHGPTWTPDLVKSAFLAAMTWCVQTGGPVGPRGTARVALHYRATLTDHLAEGWGLPEIAGDDMPDERRLRVQPPPAVVSFHRAALAWPAAYLCPANVGSARMLGLWATCKARRHSFDRAVKERGNISRGHAYVLRDRGLSLIAQGLDRDRVPLSG